MTHHLEGVPPAPGRDPAALTAGRLLVRNAAGNLLSQCVPMAVALVSLPWLIRGLGTDRYGVFALSWLALGYFSLFDLGLGRALTATVAAALGGDDREAIPSLVWTALGLMAGLGVAGGGVVALLTPWLVTGALGITGDLRPEALGAFRLMAVALPFLIVTSGLRGVLEAYQRLGAANVMRSLTSLTILLGPLAVLPWSRDLRAVVGMVVAARVFSATAHAAIVLRELPALRRPALARPEWVGRLLRFGGWMTAVNVINPVMVQMDRFFVGALVSTAAVTYYTTPSELITKSWFLSNALLGVAFPAFATSFAADRARTADLLGRCLRQVTLLLLPVALVSVALGGEVLGTWLGPEFARQGTRPMQWLALGVLLGGIAHVPSALVQAVGRPDLTFKIHLAELPIYLAAAWWLIRTRGIEGAAIAWAGRTALDLALYLMAAVRVLPECRAGVLRSAWAALWATAALGVAALPQELGWRVATLVSLTAASVLWAWSRWLDPTERAALARQAGALRRRLTPARRGPFPPALELTGNSYE